MHLPPDALSCVLQWLRAHPDLPLQLRAGGVAGGAARVSGRESSAYPCLRVQVTPAGAGGLQWQTNTELMLELLDDPKPHKQIGSEQQLRLLQRCLWILADLPDADQPLGGRHEVVTYVGAGAGPFPDPDTATPSQPRWLATVSVNAHPAPQAQTQEV